jgi:acetoin utilization protein AcuB
MDKYNLRHLPVWSDGKLVGIVSARDLDCVRSLAHAEPAVIHVEDAMTANPYAPSPDTLLVDVVRTMVERKLGSAVVMDGGQIVGIFTATDAMRALVDLIGGATGAALGGQPRRGTRLPLRPRSTRITR